ncbi:MAG: hypothetical protein K6F68_01125 [Clostridiales bacterium]|nr:hypothetical protein [Clostridiales bacterium]
MSNETAVNNKTGKPDELLKIVDRMSPDGIMTLFDVIENEKNEFMLDREKRAILRETLGYDDRTADSWKTAADVLKRFDTSELVMKYPQQAKNTLITILGIFPATRIASLFVDRVPEDLLSTILGYSLAASPDHLLHLLVDHQANMIATRNAGYMQAEPEFAGKRSLAFVTKDDLLFSEMRKLVETNDDEEDRIVGTRDGTVRLVRWDEKKWRYRRNANATNDKVIVMGDIPGAKNDIKLMEPRFEKYGVKYGWIGGCAYVDADLRKIRGRYVYDAFLAEFSSLPLPPELKKDKKMRLDVKTGLKAALAAPLLAKDLYDDTYAVKRQMLFYGLIRLYYGHLEEFLNETL